MPEARLVVVESEGWVLKLLQKGLRDHGFTVTTATTAKDGYQKVCALEPECIVCDAVLPDHDGYWLASRVRAEPSPVSVTPLLFLSPEDDAKARLKSFQCGADAFVTRPFRLDELVAQINALVVLARRMRSHRRSMSDSLAAGPPSSAEEASFEGELEHMSLPSLLAILEMERRTGQVSVRSSRRRVTLDFVGGFITEATLDGAAADPVNALRDALPWSKGRVTFRAAIPAPARLNSRPIRVLIAEAKPQPKSTPPASRRAPTPPPPKKGPPHPPPKKTSTMKMPALAGDNPTRRVRVKPEDEKPPSTKRP